jgi:hypothetical protein
MIVKNNKKEKMRYILSLSLMCVLHISFAQKDTVLYNYNLLALDSNATIYYYETPKVLYSTYDTKNLDRSKVEDFVIMDMSSNSLAEVDSFSLTGKSGGAQSFLDKRYKYAREQYYYQLFSKIYFSYDGMQWCILKMLENTPNSSPEARTYIHVLKNNKWYGLLPNLEVYNLFAILFSVEAKYLDDIFVYKTSKNVSLNQVIKESLVGDDLDLAEFCILLRKKINVKDPQIMQIVEKL